MASGSSIFIVDADLHGLVDGHIEPDRRAETLRRLAASPADRARVEAWQSQNDQLRSAFAGVDREPLPFVLDVTAKPRLQAIGANDSPLVDQIGAVRKASARRRPVGLAIATILVIAAGLGGTWLVLDSADTDESISAAQLRGSVDATLATRSAEALGQMAPAAVSPDSGAKLPSTDIPDLRASGFSFTGAEVTAAEPASILFRYQNAAAERVAVSVARATPNDVAKAPPVPIGSAYSWHKRDNAFAIAGTLRPARLRAIAVALQNDQP